MNNFPCISDGIIPVERVRVFISSAMNNENETDWVDVRKRVCNKLKKCPYINPFTIEEHVREIPSSQYFLYEVQQCDILILLLKNEIRPGVRQEIEMARNNRKAIIPYFYNAANLDSDATKLKTEFIASDYCTFKTFDSFNNLENVIFNDLLHNIIDKYKYQHFLDSRKQIDTIKSVENLKYQETDSPSTQIILKFFQSCYGTIANEVGYGNRQLQQKCEQEKSLFYIFGLKILKWILYGKEFVSSDEITLFTEKIKSLYNNSEWIIHRWNAIKYYVSDDVCTALQYEEKALKTARNENVAEWIISDILIDCRNLEAKSKDGFNFPEKYQQELDKRDELIYIPISDRYVSELYSELLDEDIKLEISLPGTQHFGGNIYYVLEKIENYIFISLINGSVTHIFIARNILSKIMYKYGKIYNSNDLLFKSIKLLILSGDTKMLNNLLLKEWEEIYYLLSANADDLWLITDDVNKRDKLNIKLLMIQLLGLYLNDINFTNAKNYLFDISLKITWNNSVQFLESIFRNMSRISPILVAEMLTNILSRGQVHMGSEISKILINLDVGNIPVEILSILEKNLEENLNIILERNGTPQFVAHLVKQCPSIFSRLESCLPQNMSTLEKSLYDINVGKNQNWSKVILSTIEDADNQLRANTESNIIHGFATYPYATIQMIIENFVDDEVINVLKEKFMILAMQVFNSKAPRDMKENCMECLIDVIILFNEKSISINKELLSIIKSLQLEKERQADLFSNSTLVTSMYRWIMLKAVSGIDVKKDILTNYLSFTKQQDSERYVLAQCIKQYILFCVKNKKQIEELFLLIIMEMCNDIYFLVRKEMVYCLVYLLQTQYSDIAKQKLISFTTDSSPNIKGEILSLIENKKINDIEFCKEILECYQQDANFGIRKRVKKIIS